MNDKPPLTTSPRPRDYRMLLLRHGRTVSLSALAVTGLVAVAAGVYLQWGQPVRNASILEFRPTFDGARQGRYPNQIPFAASDVTAGAIIDMVFDANNISEYCPREAFRGGFFVEERSTEASFLQAEYQARLSDSRMTAVERQRLQSEYEAKRQALPLQYRVMFVKPRPCAQIPQVVVTKSMNDVLTTWASESEHKRGVLNHQVEVLTPAMLDVGLGREGSRLLRADLLRTALWRIIDNVAEVEKVPGARLIRFGESRMTFAEVRNRLVDLARSRLEPLVVGAGQSMVRESVTWVAETVASAERAEIAAGSRASAYQNALREYSGQGQAGPPASTDATGPRSDVQTLSPQIDRTFIDRIVEMSEANTLFRQSLTESMVEARVEEVAAAERASYYRRLLASLRSPGVNQLTTEQIDERLNEIVQQGQQLTRDFNALYDEFSRVALRTASGMYQVETPVFTEMYREFTLRDYLVLIAATLLLALALCAGVIVGREWYFGLSR